MLVLSANHSSLAGFWTNEKFAVGGVEWSGVGGWSGVGLNPNLVSALAPFVLVKVGAEIGAELDNCQ